MKVVSDIKYIRDGGNVGMITDTLELSILDTILSTYLSSGDIEIFGYIYPQGDYQSRVYITNMLGSIVFDTVTEKASINFLVSLLEIGYRQDSMF